MQVNGNNEWIFHHDDNKLSTMKVIQTENRAITVTIDKTFSVNSLCNFLAKQRIDNECNLCHINTDMQTSLFGNYIMCHNCYCDRSLHIHANYKQSKAYFS